MGCRSHEDLQHNIFQCLSQLASLSGTVFDSDKDRTLYMTLFASELLDYIKKYPNTYNIYACIFVQFSLFLGCAPLILVII